jgi:predicted nucleotidyltransferase component of viral defense system
LAFNTIVVWRYRSHLESRQLAPGTINLRLGAVRRLPTKQPTAVFSAPIWLRVSATTPQLRTYSKESVVAEKFEAIVKLGIANSRMKDFYDLWVLANRFRFESTTLTAAIEATFQTRRTALPVSAPLAFTADFYDLPSKKPGRL